MPCECLNKPGDRTRCGRDFLPASLLPGAWVPILAVCGCSVEMPSEKVWTGFSFFTLGSASLFFLLMTHFSSLLAS